MVVAVSVDDKEFPVVSQSLPMLYIGNFLVVELYKLFVFKMYYFI